MGNPQWRGRLARLFRGVYDTRIVEDAVNKVIACLGQVFENKGQTPPALSGETALDHSIGLESVDFAELVVRLEDAFGFDPFSQGAELDVLDIKTLASLYKSTGSK